MKLIRLMTGEDIVADINGASPENITLKSPIFNILMNPTNGQVVIMPWLQMAAAGQNVTIKQEHVLYIVEPHEELRKSISKQTGGITTASPAEAAAVAKQAEQTKLLLG